MPNPDNNRLTFDEILQEKMAFSSRQNEISAAIKPASFAPTPEPFNWTSINVDVSIMSFSPKRAYQQSTRKRTKPTNTIRSTSPTAKLILETRYSVFEFSAVAQLSLHILEINTSAESRISLSIVKKAYRRMARLRHPDLDPNATTDAFTKIKEAYEILSKEIVLKDSMASAP